MTVLVSVLLLFIAANQIVLSQLNLSPVIGILTQPTNSTGIPKFEALGTSYLPASYVKWLQSAGARVVPIPYDAEEVVLNKIFFTINGILFPGGDVDIPGSIYEKTSSYLYNLALKANDRGDYFPIWGTCQGFEQLLMMTSGNLSILEHFNAEDYSVSLMFAPAFRTSRIFSNLPEKLIAQIQNRDVCENLHEQGITPHGFTHNNLQSFYTVLSTNLDRDGKEFVSTMEALRYPIYATQWHPERNQFEWDPQEPIEHSLLSIECVQYLANFFVEETRKNGHNWVAAYDLIDKYSTTFSGDANRYYMTTYFWK